MLITRHGGQARIETNEFSSDAFTVPLITVFLSLVFPAHLKTSHNSGHFTKIVWKRGVGLVEYASGYGAHADGFRLKRQQ